MLLLKKKYVNYIIYSFFLTVIDHLIYLLQRILCIK